MSVVIPPEFTIVTNRCRLRQPTAADLPRIFTATQVAGFNDGMQWEPPQSIEELHAPLQENLLAWNEGIMYVFTIVPSDTDELIGRIGIRKTSYPDVWNLGFWTHPDCQGQGYMTEAASTILTLGFDRLGAMRIEASYALWNLASKRVLSKIGMKFVKYIPHAFQKQGRWIEANKMTITRAEWLAVDRTDERAKYG
jgi:[ribosomal protein S5]-alanine N-acetyltransferase